MSAAMPDPFFVPSAPTDWRRRILIAVGVFLVVVLVVGVVMSQAADSSTDRYRTALVADHDVESVITGVGSIEPVSQATVAFPISATVATVDVAVGDAVMTGQTLATADTTDLTAALHDKQAALASAELALSKAVSGSSSASTAASGSTTTTTASAPSNAGSTPSGSTAAGSIAAVSSAQQGVLTGQKAVDAALATANQALASSVQVCAAATAVTTDASTSTDAVSACQTALQSVQDAQAAVAAAQQSLATSSAALDALLAEQAAGQASAGSTASTGSTSSSSTGGSSSASSRPATGSRGADGAADTSSSASSSDLIAGQKAVDAAAAEVAVAEQELAQSTIVSPVSGSVVSVTMAVGDDVDAASTSAHIVVVGDGGFEVTTMVSVDHIPDVKVGQRATVLPDGATDPIGGEVVAIALSPTTATTGTTYRVTIGLDDQGAGLGNGATGSVSIVTAGVTSSLAVPTSAVRTDGTSRIVTVVDGSTTSSVTVKVGVVGSTYTQITDGLTAGQSVLLADLDEPLPGSATSSSNGTTSTNPFPGGVTGAPPGFGGGGR